MRILKHIINWTVWTLLGLYLMVMAVIHIPQSQNWLGHRIGIIISEKLGTQATVGRVDLGFLNRLILDDVIVLDQHNRTLLKAARLTAKIDFAPLAFGRISISSAQIFGAHLQLSRPSANSPLNCQFVVDSLASRDTTESSPLNLRINSLIMRQSSVTYDQWDTPSTPERFNAKHLNLTQISSHIILKALTDDSININVKRLTCIEKSGLNIQRLAFRLAVGRRSATLQQLQLQLPDSYFQVDSLMASYDSKRLVETLTAKGNISNTTLTPSDFRWLLPQLKTYQRKIAVAANFNYHNEILKIPNLELVSEDGQIDMLANGHIHVPQNGTITWGVKADHLNVGENTTDFISKQLYPLPAPVLRLGNIQLEGNFSGDTKGTLSAQANIKTDIGDANTEILLTGGKHFNATLTTDGLNIGQLLDNEQFGLLAADVETTGTLNESIKAQGHIERFDYKGSSYQDINLDGSYADHHLAGQVQVNDTKLSAMLDFDIHAHSLNDAVGVVSLRGLNLPEENYRLEFLRLESGFDEGRHYVTLNSDFAHADLVGEFDYATLAQSVANAIGQRMPTLPGMPPLTNATNNNFTLNLAVAKTDWMQRLMNIQLDVSEPLSLTATVNDRNRHIKVDLKAPAFSYNDSHYEHTTLHIDTPNDTLTLQAMVSSVNNSNQPLCLSLAGHAVDNKLQFALNWDNNDKEKPVSGVLNATTQLYQNMAGKPEAHVNILPSNVLIDNSVWQVEPSDILYSTDRLLVDHFTVHNSEQYITIDGTASERASDSLIVNLKGVEVAYILDLINFDAVTFAGQASGQAFLTSAFASPDASATIRVDNFKFQDGRMGALTALVGWNKQQKQIDINATANDGPDATTYINGYVSPERNYIDLGISAHGTYLDFMHSFTDSFISHITGHGTGNLRLAGPLSAINLTGGLIVNGEATITPLNTTYQLRNDTLTLVYNHILLDRQPIYDRFNNVAYLSGGIHHEDLTNLSLDLHVNTNQFLGYDFRDFGDQSFYGTVYAAGNVDIRMKDDDVNIDCDITPLKNSVFVYNAAQADAIAADQEFITWKAPQASSHSPLTAQHSPQSTTNIYMTFLVNATPEATMRILMDAKTGDYITLNGNGTLQASYYNKGTFQMQGTYTVESGTYDVTIQNIINKKFQFQPGGTMVFGGDPYNASLNLQALYTVNGVSLSDLNIGNSFSSNTVRVNCLMNIGGQPSSPQVTFDLDLPNVNADEKQMVRSLLSSQQEMNQQVLYLLGIGRFYSQGQNNANQQEQQGQTTLAMQSFLSGTLSTQINNVINQFVKNEDWNFGANISTGTEGWNNAEYEGIINGRMLNNRLLINGQFGYRDNATRANPSFIGDFDVRYLLTPNGNYALKVYNQTNDRYFTRSSLNTQGVGIIMKRDFNGLSDFFKLKKSPENK